MKNLYCLLVAGWIPLMALAQDVTETQLPIEEMARAAVLIDDLEALTNLSKQGASLGNMMIGDWPLLTYAGMFGSVDAAAFLLKNGADINATDPGGYTPIMRALEAGHVDLAIAMSKVGADLTIIGNDGHSVRTLAELVGLEDFGPYPAKTEPLTLTKEEANKIALAAAEAGDLQAYTFAMDQGADTGVIAENGWSAIMLAALGGKTELMKHFISEKHGPDWGKTKPYNVDGITAIHAALVATKAKTGQQVFDILTELKKSEPFKSALNDATFRTILDKSKFSASDKALLTAFFPYPPLPELDYALPFGVPESPGGWRKVQTILTEKGLYTGAIDGKPGPNTYQGLMAYVEPLIFDLIANASLAAERSHLPVNKALQNNSGYAYRKSGGELGVVDNSHWQVGELIGSPSTLSGYQIELQVKAWEGKLREGSQINFAIGNPNFGSDGFKARLSLKRSFGQDPSDFDAHQFYISLFDSEISFFFYKTDTSMCVDKEFDRCLRTKIVRDFNEHNDPSKWYALFLQRETDQKKAEARQRLAKAAEEQRQAKEQEEARAAKWLERQQKAQEFSPLPIGMRRLTPNEVDEKIIGKKFETQTGIAFTFNAFGQIVSWSPEGAESSRVSYTVTDQNNYCSGFKPQQWPTCYYWAQDDKNLYIVNTTGKIPITEVP